MVKESDYLISNQEILGGLKAAVERGESLKDAMMTFYQSGYDKYEIEDAARAYLNQQKGSSQGLNPTQRVQEKKQPEPVQEKPKEVRPKPKPLPMPKTPEKKKITPQKASAYDHPKKKPSPPKNNALTIILILIFLFLIGILAAVILFKSELIEFINRIFG